MLYSRIIHYQIECQELRRGLEWLGANAVSSMDTIPTNARIRSLTGIVPAERWCTSRISNCSSTQRSHRKPREFGMVIRSEWSSRIGQVQIKKGITSLLRNKRENITKHKYQDLGDQLMWRYRPDSLSNPFNRQRSHHQRARLASQFCK